MPVVVNEKRQKLSKRRDKVALEAYRDEGYLADAMRNYLMLLGWAPSGDREIVPWSVIEEEFRLEDVNPSPAFFDEKKLRAFNGEYIRALSDGGLHRGVPALADRRVGGAAGRPVGAARTYDPAAFAAVAPLAQTRIAVLSRDRAQRRLPVPGRAGDRRGVLGQGDEGRAPADLLDATVGRASRPLPAWDAER